MYDIGLYNLNNSALMESTQKNQRIVVTSKELYSCFEKVLCCKCFTCFQEDRIMTSDIRKETIQRMMETYLLEDNDQVLYDPVKLMILIYVCNDDSIPSKHIERCKLNPSTGVINYRSDLEFYIPQICNYLVFHRNLEYNYLLQAIQKMCRLNFYFAHLYYFYMRSIQKNITKAQIQVLRPVVDYNDKFLQKISEHFQTIKLTSMDLYSQAQRDFGKNDDQFVKKVIIDYQTTKKGYGKYTKVQTKDISLDAYRSIFDGQNAKLSSFHSTLRFFDDLFYMCDDLKNHDNKKEKAIQYLKMINEQLPAAVYVPFSKNSIRLCNVLKIVTSQTKVFSTKQRAPVCICIETYCPSQNLNEQEQQTFWTNVETPITLKMSTFENRTSYFARNYEKTAEFRQQRQTSFMKKRVTAKNIMEEQRQIQLYQNSFRMKQQLLDHNIYSTSMETQLNSVKSSNAKTIDNSNFSQSDNSRTMKDQEQTSYENKTNRQIEMKCYNFSTKKYFEQGFQKLYGEPLKQSKKRISKTSIFGNLASWDTLYIIIKTNDDLKQEQFAMQLIHQFDYIFKLEKLPLVLTTYEVLSMGPDRGIIQMVKDAVTFDSLKKTLKTDFPNPLTLKDFFQIYFQADLAGAKQTFMKSLAAYSLVMYILQAKDRHNGNILLHRNGKIFHIDFGFFLSNSPGKGIQLQRDCPFKLLSQYIEVLDGVDSYYFKKFRQYFFLGFKAIKKHQNKIIMLVKMMYSASGMSMPCFSKGEQAIIAMQNRINPPEVNNDLLLNQHCQRLINQSLDNWASKWYDRFQYWAQGIFY